MVDFLIHNSKSTRHCGLVVKMSGRYLMFSRMFNETLASKLHPLSGSDRFCSAQRILLSFCYVALLLFGILTVFTLSRGKIALIFWD